MLLESKSGHSKLIIFDLDETLVHSPPNGAGSDAVVDFQTPSGEAVQIGINIRPGAIDLLTAAS